MQRYQSRLFNLRSTPNCVTNANATLAAPQRYRFRNDSHEPVIHIYDEIGEGRDGSGLSAKSVVDTLDENRHKPISVRINSFGGDVYEGLVMFNALATHPNLVTVIIEGIAFSAASYIAMAGDRLKMYRNSDLGIHRASTVTLGNRHDHISTAKWLDKIDEHLISIYEDRTKKTPQEIERWLDGTSDGTVFTATEALRYGFCDEIIDPRGVSNRYSETRQNASMSSGRKASSRKEAEARLRRMRVGL